MFVKETNCLKTYLFKIMDFLKEIVKEIGDDYTKLASDIDDTEKYVDTGSYILTDLFRGVYLVVYLGIRLLPLLASLVLEKLFSLLLSLRISLILTLMVIVYILTLKPLLTSLFSQIGV